jgi:cytochrome c-type biogenesis protein CcmE
MTPKKKRRLAFAIAIVAAGAAAAALILFALKDNVLYFYSPSDLATHQVSEGTSFRIGGLVEDGSVKKGPGALVRFTITDGKAQVPVEYADVLPALFREGQGVVAMGSLRGDHVFVARQVLAKHDEKYMPAEVVDALKRSGRWKEGEATP